MLKTIMKYGITGAVCIALLIITGKYVESSKLIQDTEAPKINFSSDEIETVISGDESELLKGVTAQDDLDGDVTDSLMVENVTKKTDGDYNEFLITYVAFDEANNCGRASRTLRYTDYHAPHFEISQALRFPVTQSVDLLNYISATDVLDGDVSAYIKISGLENFQGDTTEAGLYECTASVTNSVGDTATIPISVEFYVNSYETQLTSPQIILKQYITYLEQGADFYAGDYLDYVTDNGNKSIDYGPMVEKEEWGETKLVTEAEADGKPGNWININTIECSTSLDTSVPGTYKAIYTYTSEQENYTGTAQQIIVVEPKKAENAEDSNE